jgi:hypothetical protein
MAQQAFTMHSEPIDLPSKGWFYPETSPLATGRVDIYYMTAKHEDILTSKNLIAKGVVLDKLMEELKKLDPNSTYPEEWRKKLHP